MRSYNPRSVLIGVIGMSIHLRVWGINSSFVLSELQIYKPTIRVMFQVKQMCNKIQRSNN